MAKPAAYAAGGQLLSAHEQVLRKDLDPRVLEYLRAFKENLANSTAWLNYAVSLSDYHWMNTTSWICRFPRIQNRFPQYG